MLIRDYQNRSERRDKAEKSEEDKAQNVKRDGKQIHQSTLRQLYEYVDSEDVEELEFMWEAYHVNLELFEEGT